MYIQFNTDEKASIEAANLPNGTTLLESSAQGDPRYRYIIKDGKLLIEHDFIEERRAWKNGEKEEFMSGLTQEKVMDFFLADGEWSTYREYSAVSEAEGKLFKYFSHNGMYLNAPNGGRYNLFQITLNQDCDLIAATKEISWGLERILAYYPEWNPIEIHVFEHTCSEFGIHTLRFNRDTKFELIKNSYGRETTLKEFSNLHDTLEYIAKNHYYE